MKIFLIFLTLTTSNIAQLTTRELSPNSRRIVACYGRLPKPNPLLTGTRYVPEPKNRKLFTISEKTEIKKETPQ